MPPTLLLATVVEEIVVLNEGHYENFSGFIC